ncbi:MAG TPA: hypothetical protein ENN69_08040, partial [Spirochaetia bacterium]|nr:hypothetical protein [Spirochaetia bacterium]
MSRIGKLILAVLLLPAAAGSAIAEEALHLSRAECVRRALDANTSLTGARLDLDAAAAGRDAASMLYLPSLQVSAGYNRLSPRDPAAVSIPGVGTVELSPALPDNWLFRVELRQNLFAGFKVQSAADAARFSYE